MGTSFLKSLVTESTPGFLERKGKRPGDGSFTGWLRNKLVIGEPSASHRGDEPDLPRGITLDRVSEYPIPIKTLLPLQMFS
jgi:hypothetical protein